MKIVGLLLISILTVFSSGKNEFVINAGIPGNNTFDLLKRINPDVIEESPDLAIIMIGTNDMLNSQKMLSYEEYKLNLEKIVQTLKVNQVKVVLCSPPTVDTVYLFERHDSNLFTEKPNQKLDSVAHIMKKMSNTDNVFFVDINKQFRDMNVPVHNYDEYIQNEKNSNVRDGVHPTSVGYTVIAEAIFNFLKEHNLISVDVNIICFGDSITFGLGVEGKGTTTGDTYPAQLSSMIETFLNIPL